MCPAAGVAWRTCRRGGATRAGLGEVRHLVAGLPARLHLRRGHRRAGGGSRAGERGGGGGAGHAPARAADHLAGLRREPGRLGGRARAGLRLADARVRHHRPLPDRPPARRRGGLRRPGRGRPRARAAGPARRGLQPCGPGVPGLPAGAGAGPGRTGGLVVPADLAGGLAAGRGAGVRHVRGARGPGRAQPRRAGRGRVRGRGDEPLAGRGCGRLAAGRGLRRARGLLGAGGAPGPGRASRGVPGRRGDPRRLPGVRGRIRPGLGHPVRAVESHLERAERPQPVRAGPRPGPGTTGSWRRSRR